MIPDSVILLALVVSILALTHHAGRHIHTKADTK